MVNFIYKYLTETKSRFYDISIKDAIETIEKYDLWVKDYADVGQKSKDTVVLSQNAFFKREKDNGKIAYDLFYDNLHIHASVSETEKIYSIRLKNPEDSWTFNETTISKPTNNYYEVYVWYVIPVPDMTKAEGYNYKHGRWDKYVFKSMNDFFSEVKGETDTSKFNSYYNS